MPLHSVSAGRITHIDYEDNLCGQRPSKKFSQGALTIFRFVL